MATGQLDLRRGSTMLRGNPNKSHMKDPDINKIAQHYASILEELGADLSSEGMKETPVRAAKAMVEMTEGSRMGTEQLTKMFKAECTQAVCHDMVIVEGIKEVGLCEHHLLPIIMSITIAYEWIAGCSRSACGGR